MAIIKAKLERGLRGKGRRDSKTQEDGILPKSRVCAQVSVCERVCAISVTPFIHYARDPTNCFIRKNITHSEP